MIVRDIMTANPRTVSPTDSLQAAAQVMREEDTGAVPVVAEGRLVGLVTDRDIVLRGVAQGMASGVPVGPIASKDIETVTPETSTKEAAAIMAEHQIRRLPVVEDGRLVGILSLGDLAVKEGKDSRIGETLE
jgi:CBS domain-containing protein